MTDDFSLQMFWQLADAARRLAATLAGCHVNQVFVRLALLQLLGDLLELLQREQQQLVGIDAFLAGTADALQEKRDLMLERGDLTLFLFQRLRKLFDDRLMLRVRFRKFTLRLRQQFLEPFVFVSQIPCVHVACYARRVRVVLFTCVFFCDSKKNTLATTIGRKRVA